MEGWMLGSLCTLCYWGMAACTALVPAAAHPLANPISKVIQCASALTFIGLLWLLCLEHIILMGGNQINSKPQLTSASCEDGWNSVCCTPGSPNHANLLACCTRCVQWEIQKLVHFNLSLLQHYSSPVHSSLNCHNMRNLKFPPQQQHACTLVDWVLVSICKLLIVKTCNRRGYTSL